MITVLSFPIFHLNNQIQKDEYHSGFKYSYWNKKVPLLKEEYITGNYVLLLTRTKRGTLFIDSISHDLKGNQLHVLFPEHKYSWVFPDNSDVYLLTVSPDKFNIITSILFLNVEHCVRFSLLDLSIAEYNLLRSEFEIIGTELKKDPLFYNLLIARIFIITISALKKIENDHSKTPLLKQSPILQKFVSLIEKHYMERKDVQFYADKLHITPNYLTIICNRDMGKSALVMIRERILLGLRNMLSTTDFSIKEISYLYHFSDPSKFSKYFKEYTGFTPKEFRKALKTNNL
ncbi:hypothetical protein CMT19_16720 [Elizabethkingia anophelis]|nr:hypothetical protein [Elizabethkingia anophelis]